MTVQHLPPMAASRPLGVAILAVLIGLVGVLTLIVAVAALVLFSGLALLTQFSFFGAGVVGGVLLLVFSIVLLVVAVGLWRLEMWALVLSAIVLFLVLVSDALRGNLLSFSTIVVLLLLLYLVLVRRHFR
jgi:hypothetical protein